MLRNYLVVALRNFSRNKIFSVINILGLSIGISASLVIFLIVQYDNSFDRIERNAQRIFRVVSDYAFQGEPGHTRGVPAPLADAVSRKVSGVDNLVHFRYYNPEKLSVQTALHAKPKVFKSPEHIIFADEHYFQMLPYHWLAGSVRSASSDAGQVVLSASRAKLYFPSKSFADMIGEKILYDDSIIARVSGIVEDLDKQGRTTFNFLEFISLPTILKNTGLRKRFEWDEWGSTTSDQQLYLVLSEGTAVTAVEKKLKAIFEENQGADAKKNNFIWTYSLQPLDDIHFNSHYGNFDIELASRSVMLGLTLVAAFLILIASINFINLSTAQASQRAKEIGMRKTMGSSQSQLIFQFLGETFLVTLIASILSIVLAPLLLKTFSDYIPTGLSFSLANPLVIVFLCTLVISVTLLAGLYPAWILSSMNVLEVLKTRGQTGKYKTRNVRLRQGLTVSQFVIAQFFVIGAVLVSKQIHFMLSKDLGFKRDEVLSFKFPQYDTSNTRRTVLMNELKEVPGIALVTIGNDLPSSNGWWTTTMDYDAAKKPIQTNVELKSGDSNYLKLFHIPLLAGRNLRPGDTTSEVLINETYLHLLGFTQPGEAIGKMVKWNNRYTPIVGIFKDFHAHPLNYKIAPMAFCHEATRNHVMILTLQTESNANRVAGTGSDLSRANWPLAITKMKKLFQSAYPGEEFSYSFLDDDISKAYGSEQKISKLLKWSTGLTIFISCLGLLGLVIYTTTQRTKEIGIRKVLGASVTQIMKILSGDFIKLVIIAFLIAIPIAWWAIHAWLDGFVFRTEVSWWIFPLSGLVMIGIALITLSVQTIKTATANPARSLNTE
jgi:ABC-type antimicrobial peptide transport system permease subunit